MQRGLNMLFIAWQHPESRRVFPVARLRPLASGRYELVYIRAVTEAKEHGFSGLPGFDDFERRYVSRNLPAIFERRARRLAAADEATELAGELLDAAPISLFVPLPGGATMRLEAFAPPLCTSSAPGAGEYWGVFAARGVGHMPSTIDAVERIEAHERLVLSPEPDNAYNPHAILLCRGDRKPLGYVPDYLANEIAAAGRGSSGMSAEVLRKQRLNFPPQAPIYQVLCRYTCDAGLGRRLFRSPSYAPHDAKVVALR